ncbi:recombinase family protein [Rhodococcoides fascians]|uniref:recombinase family protein n=1 Tax=Rhodococcoides fascians TaxID=1828 RepID=UPI002789F422|nr:recombinase family protein [Rhodococcus fascians]MDQ0281740.1 DNA invertase Pin-like site-specific DNA recombinase [Rhodococcus fascians]
MTNVLLYVRVSKNITGKARSTEQQENVLRAEIAESYPDWEIVGVVKDESISASEYTTKERPGYLELQRRVSEGGVDIVGIYEFSRLTRRGPGSDWEHLTGLFRSHGVKLFDNGIGRALDFNNPEDVHYAETAASQAKVESARISKRVKRDTADRAAKGGVHSQLGFGWKKDDDSNGWVLDPIAAEAIRTAALDILDGSANLTTIAKRWNAAGIDTGTGRKVKDPETGDEIEKRFAWTNGGVRKALVRASVAGLRVFRGETLKERGAWEPILDMDTYARLKAVLSDPSRRMNRGTAPNHLLTGIARCGVCQRGLSFINSARFDHTYRCPTGHVYRSEVELDKHIEEKLFEAIYRYATDLFVMTADSETEPDDSEGTAAHLAEAAKLEEQLTHARNAMAEGAIPMAEYLEIAKLIQPKIDGHKRDAERAAPNRVLYDFASAVALDPESPGSKYGMTVDGGTPPVWENADLATRRMFVRAALEIVVHPIVGKPNNGPFDPAFVTVRFLG